MMLNFNSCVCETDLPVKLISSIESQISLIICFIMDLQCMCWLWWLVMVHY